MYPYEIFLGLDLYSILLCVGIFVCILTYSRLADTLYLSAKLQKFCFICAVFAIPLGYGSAVLFQALYNIKENGGFVLSKDTGATFYGGLIGGAAVFLLIYFVAGHFLFSDGYHRRNFFGVANCAAASIALAHACGRVGCLMAGCCHGKLTEEWYGIYMHGDFGYEKYVPVQLFEALFLFALSFVLCYLFFVKFGRENKGRFPLLPIYAIGYGVWRFCIEFARADERGETIISALSPSQLIAVIMVVAAVGYLCVWHFYKKRKMKIEEDRKE